MRDTANIAAAFDSIQGMQKDSQLQGFPTGHFVGFFIDIEDGAVKIGPGEANVGGTEVIQRTTNTLEENSWAITRERGYMYYIYLKRDGLYWVDNQDPEWDSLLAGWYHPLLRYRYIGKIFNDTDGKIIYKLSVHYNQQSSIIVGAKGFTGYQDYECDGVDDQEQINLALKFASESGGETGGKVHLTRGYFYTTAAIEMRSNCTLEGEGQGATVVEKNCNDYAIECIGTSVIHKENVTIRDLTVSRDDSDTNNKELVYFSYTDKCSVENVSVESSAFIVTRFDFCQSASVVSCLFSGGIASWCIYSNYTSCRIQNNTFENMTFPTTTYSTGGCYGVVLIFSDGSVVSGNSFNNNFGNGLNAIWVSESDNVMISGNHVNNCFRMGPDSDPVIKVVLGNANSVTGNRCSNNGNLIDRGYCELTTPPYLTGETDDNQSDCTFARSSDFAHTGTYSYKFTKTNAAGGAQARSRPHNHTDDTAADMAGLIAGCSYTFSAWIYIPAASGILYSEVRMSLDDDTGAATNTDATEVYDAWQYVEVTRTLGAAATGVQLAFVALATAEANEYFYVDDIRLRPDGVHNEHGQNFSDAGTGTRTSGNSWQNPFQS